MSDITMKEMLQAGVHFGHQTRLWDPKMAPYIYGARQGIHIINLEKSLPLFQKCVQALSKVAANKGKILFVGTKHAAREIIREEAIRCGMPYVDKRWLGGMLTNYPTMRRSIERLKDLEGMLGDQELISKMTKKEVSHLMREKDKLAESLSGIKNMRGLPDALFIIDIKHEKIAIREAKRLRIPVAAIVDTNSNPDGIDYVIPGNDDALRAIRFYCKHLADSIIEARGVLDIQVSEEETTKQAVVPVIKKKVVTKKTAPATGEKEQPVKAEKSTAKKTDKKPAAKKPVAEKKMNVQEATKTRAKAEHVSSAPSANNDEQSESPQTVSNVEKQDANVNEGE